MRCCVPLRTIAMANPQGKDLGVVRLDDPGPEFASAACLVALRPLLLAALAELLPERSSHLNSRALKVEAEPGRLRLHLALDHPAGGLAQEEIRYSGQT